MQNTVTPELLQEWRQTNPGNLQNRQSFAEIVESVALGQEEGRLSLVFNLLADEWNIDGQQFSPKDFYAHLKSRTDDDLVVFERFRRRFFYQRANEPVRGNATHALETLSGAFGFDEARKLMLYRIAGGQYPDLKQLEEDLDKVITKSKKTGKPIDKERRRSFMSVLQNDSGLSKIYVAERLGIVPQMYSRWLVKNSWFPSKLEQVENLVETLLPRFLFESDADHMRVTQKTIQVVWGADLKMKLDEVIAIAQKSKEPVKTFVGLMYGRKGILGNSIGEMAAALGRSVADLDNRIYLGTSFDEDFADEIATLCMAENEKQREDIIEILTGIPSSVKLVQSVMKGDITFAEAAKKMRRRRGLTCTDMNEKNKNFSRTMLMAIEAGRKVKPATAKAHADFFFVECEDAPERQYHICMAQKLEAVTAVEMAERVSNGTVDRKSGYHHVLAVAGVSSKTLARQNGVDPITMQKRALNEDLSADLAEKIRTATGLPVQALFPFSFRLRIKHQKTRFVAHESDHIPTIAQSLGVG